MAASERAALIEKAKAGILSLSDEQADYIQEALRLLSQLSPEEKEQYLRHLRSVAANERGLSGRVTE